jgi:sulfite reductase (NADPH) flavoprotein alpha-component
MLRALHRWPGMAGLLLVALLGLSGAALSVFPAAEQLTSPQAAPELSVGALAARVRAHLPGLEQLRRSPSGQITAYWFENGAPGAAVIDPATGAAVASADGNPGERWLVGLHRQLFAGDMGRLVMAAGAGLILVLCLSGAALVARRMAGWRNWFGRARGAGAGRLHVELARIAIAGLALSALTALWMTASTFELLPDAAKLPRFPDVTSGRTGMAPDHIGVLVTLPVAELRELGFPAPNDPTDVFTLKTDRGAGYLDQGSGAVLAWADTPALAQVSEVITMLHTGRGAAVLGLVLGLAALSVPIMAASGLVLYLVRWRARPRIRANAAAARAETVILVGSEAGSTWGFAATLQRALTKARQVVHVAPMSGFDPGRYRAARRVLILAATYGEGAAPASASGFLERLAKTRPLPAVATAVLGFGDRSFPEFCAYAETVSQALAAGGWDELLPLAAVDRQSPQDFAYWGRALGQALGLDLDLVHQPVQPASAVLTLLSRRDFGAEVQAPTAILRFAVPRTSLWQRLTGGGFSRFEAGDLLAVLPEGAPVPRLYSLASSRRDGFVEIVVRKHPQGVCSTQLVALEPGETVRAFIRRNPTFHAEHGRAPLLLIGAGTGIGPLAGFIRANRHGRPVHLFFGLRHKASDFLFAEELGFWQEDGRLAGVTTATSRGARPHYVQDALRAEARQVQAMIHSGARIMVCGGRDMAAGVRAAMTDILAPIGATPEFLKAQGRYVEDIF